MRKFTLNAIPVISFICFIFKYLAWGNTKFNHSTKVNFILLFTFIINFIEIFI